MRDEYKAIDIVFNLYDEEALNARPLWMREGFYGGGYGKIKKMKPLTTELLIEKMDRAGIEKIIMPAVKCGVEYGGKGFGGFEIPYERVYELTKKYPDRIYGLAGLDPRDGMKGIRELERAVNDLGFIGAHSYPHWFDMSPLDARYYPIYAKCLELDIPIEMQIGHAGPTRCYTVFHPILLDRIAIDFPELKVIGIHIGFPWVEESISVSWKHGNVYIGADAWAPKYWKPEFVHYINTWGKEKVIWGSDFPIIDPERSLREIDELNLREGSKRKLLRENAEKVFKF
jgi:predicted TIM-barrel fold metal-dependent hydrolase